MIPFTTRIPAIVVDKEPESVPPPSTLSESPPRVTEPLSYKDRRMEKIGPANSLHTARQVARPSPLRDMMTAS
ncbi:hypothetical protein PG996_000308 [Apiospora saccharicola]|uniref:Uncharacterized protein n=1 Tax=Apiospora saccharicola TaxID=335842 RepID=A0ABR1WDE7_9PEZI